MSANSQERLLRLALRCYPPRWRARHGEEAAELAALLAHDGVPLGSTTWSYFKGAVAERLVRTWGRGWRAGVAALVAGISLTAVSLLISVSPSAGAASVVRAVITNRTQAAAELRAEFKAHHFDIAVEPVPVSPSLVGSVLAAKARGRSTGGAGILGLVTGTCAGGAAGCTQGLLLPSHFLGHMVVLVGQAAGTGQKYAESADIFRPGELLAGSGLLGRPVKAALAVLDRSPVAVLWEVSGHKDCSATAPGLGSHVAGGFALSGRTICLTVTPALSPTTRGWG